MTSPVIHRQLLVDVVVLCAVAVVCIFGPELYPILVVSMVVTLLRGMLVAADRVIAAIQQQRREG